MYAAAIECPNPPLVDNTDVKVMGSHVGNSVTYSCLEDKHFENGRQQHVSYCTPAGTWHPLPSRCIGRHSSYCGKKTRMNCDRNIPVFQSCSKCCYHLQMAVVRFRTLLTVTALLHTVQLGWVRLPCSAIQVITSRMVLQYWLSTACLLESGATLTSAEVSSQLQVALGLYLYLILIDVMCASLCTPCSGHVYNADTACTWQH